MSGLEHILEKADTEEFQEARAKIEEGIKNRTKGVVKLDKKEIDFNGKRVTFNLSEADVARRESALSFAAILELAEAINKGE